MSTYYEYQDVKVMIALALMKLEGWTVYGYHEDDSDPMTDYFDPAYWGGIAEKNGYILCVDVHGASEATEIREYNYNNFAYDKTISEKITKLEQMTTVNGASEAEEASARSSIARLQKKAEESAENKNKYIVTGIIPGHMENPPKMNWHIEKDGIYIAKGNGILKYSTLDQYFRYGDKYMKDMRSFREDKNKWADDWVQNMLWHGYYSSEEAAREAIKSRIGSMEKDSKLLTQFEAFINKIDVTCGGLLGEGDGVIYEKITVTEYKKENKVVEDEKGEIKEGQCFILKSAFNYGCRKGLIYRIHEMTYDNGEKYYTAYKLNGKLTKECKGMASSNNNWTCFNEKFTKWIEKGAIAWCHIEEVKTPYEVEKVIKKTIKAEKKNNATVEKQTTTEATTEEVNVNNYTFEVAEDTDTRTNEKIYLVKVAEKLSREEYIKVNQYIKTLGGYYSKFKHAFLFKENPTEKLNATPTAEAETEPTPTEEKAVINEFEGESEYVKVLSNKGYYLFDSNSLNLLEDKAV